MSAIFGKLNFDGRPVSASTLGQMKQAMVYWGPDGGDTWCHNQIGLGQLHSHNTPESLYETLPWTCPESGNVITAHVRLDNRNDLLNSLSIAHSDRAEMPDGQIIMKAYLRWGEACVNHLIGDWGFAIWDSANKKLFIARDHHGNTGLYYYSDSRGLVFASSLKGLLCLPEVPRRPNPLTIAQLLVAWPAQGAPICYEGILRLPPAHSMTVIGNRINLDRYWILEQTPPLQLGSDDDYVEGFLEVFSEAVRCRLRCAAPVGSTLSGGLDSGSVTVLAAAELAKHSERLTTFSSVPITDTEGLVGSNFGDERPYIEATAKHTGNVALNYIDARQVSPVEGVERSLFIHDQPVHGAGNMFWITALMEQAKQMGLGAMLTGQGGNGTISWGGGPQPYLLEYLLKLQFGIFGHKLREWQEVTKRSLWMALRTQIVRPLLAPLRRHLPSPAPLTDAWKEYSAINPQFAHELNLNERMAQQGHDPSFGQMRDAEELRLALLRPGVSNAGHLWFEIGAAYGLEVRDPTLDLRVLSYCWSVPKSQYMRNGQNRLLIRRAMAKYLPEQVLWNRHRGVQAADLGKRILDNYTEMDAALADLEETEITRYYLDLAKMRNVFESLKSGINSDNTGKCGTILLRGLAVGLFLKAIN